MPESKAEWDRVTRLCRYYRAGEGRRRPQQSCPTHGGSRQGFCTRCPGKDGEQGQEGLSVWSMVPGWWSHQPPRGSPDLWCSSTSKCMKTPPPPEVTAVIQTSPNEGLVSWLPVEQREGHSCCCHPVAQSCPTPCDPMDCSTPGSPICHHLPRFAQIQWDYKEIKPVNPKGNQPWYSLEGLMLKLKLQYFGHLMGRADSM